MTVDPVRKIGLRERGKSERKKRIIQAARAVFMEYGYDLATTREVALRAEVAIGTVFVYAPEKRDLLFLVLNDELDDMVESAFAAAADTQPLLDQIMSIFEVFYRYFAANVTLGRFALREISYMTAFPPSKSEQASQLQARLRRVREKMSQIIEAAQRSRQIRSSEDPHLLATVVSAIYRAEIRAWLNGDAPRADEGLAQLHRLLAIVFDGFDVPARRTDGHSGRRQRRSVASTPRTRRK